MNNRILVIDDTKSIHEDFRKILAPDSIVATELASARAAFFGTDKEGDGESRPTPPRTYELTCAFQGEEGLAFVQTAEEHDEPFAVAFVDIRMPPGWDGIQTIKELWKVAPNLHCVICTAYSDYSWDEMVNELGYTDKLLILKKPFDPTEIRQVASAFTAKWNAAAREAEVMAKLSQKETEARAYASSLETLNKALSTAKASADQMSIMKSDFMMRLTSEVSTHLNAILDELVEDGRTEGIDDALDRSQRLLETIDKVIDFTQVEGGLMMIRNDPCDIREVIDDLEQTYRSRAEAKNLKLEFRISESVPSCIRTDPGRLCQVLGYLVDNAIRYTDEGRVHLSVATEPTDNWNRSRIRFDITDTGRGIGQDRMGRVFEPFSSRTTEEIAEGSGLGLTVAKQIARLLGGDVHFDSLPGEGCTFTLRLEAKREDQSVPEAGSRLS